MLCRQWFAATSVSLLIELCVTHGTYAQDRQVYLVNGWRHLSDQNYVEAIKDSTLCIQKFAGGVLKEQENISKHETEPPTGGMDQHSSQAMAIFKHGVLNDVAACYFILAQSQDASNNCPEAKKAYQLLSQLKYARIWDPQGWFWNPSEKATEWLEDKKC